MNVFVTTLWLIIACLFGILTIYSTFSRKDFKEIKKDIDNPQVIMHQIGGINYTDSYKLVLPYFYRIVRSTFIIGSIGLLLSAVAAIVSIFAG